MISLIKRGRKDPNTKKHVYYPRWTSMGKISKTELAKIMRGGSTFSVGEVEGIMTDFSQHICDQLLNGKTVEIQGLGTFTLNVNGPSHENASQVTTEGLKVTMLFKPDKSLQQRLDTESEFQFISKSMAKNK